VSPVATFSLLTIVTCVVVAVISLRAATVPGWHALRWLAPLAVSVAAYGALNIPLTASPDGPLAWAVPLAPYFLRFQFLTIGVNLWLWTRYADALLGERAGPIGRLAARAAVVVGLASQVPGLAFRDEVHDLMVGGFRYHQPASGPLAPLAMAVVLLAGAPLAARFLRAWRQGRPTAGLHAAAFLGLLALGLHDALVTLRYLGTPFLLDLGVVLPVGAVGLAMALRLVGEARDLAALRLRLEAQVEDRTRALERFREALHRAEKLAAVGELAASVAHEVNSPTAAAGANVEYLLSHLRDGHLPPDAVSAAEDAQRALFRIGEIVRRLTGAGRLATASVEPHPVALGRVMRESVMLARARCPGHVRVEEGPGADLTAQADDGLLVQVLVNLVVNGGQAVPVSRPGRVTVSAKRYGDRVLMAVEDDGEGMPAEVLARVFEPFFTTKPLGVGTGLGLSISRGLLGTIGGELRLESTPGRGTRALVDLPAARDGALALA